jgi:DNA-directed RNA polymerase subunit K/omega
MPSKSNNKSDIKDESKKKLKGGLEVKDDADKIDKEDWDSNNEEDVDEDDIEEGEEEEEDEDEDEDEDEEKEKEDKEDKEDKDGEEGDEVEDDDCLYKITKKKKILDIDLEVGEDNFEDEEVNKQNIYVKTEDRVTKPILFEFERVRILGERATQLSMGAKPMIKNVDNLDPKTIAKMELENKVIPLIIIRELPNGAMEKWKISELY